MLPFTRAMLIHRSSFHEQSFEKGHPRKVPVKLFQNWTTGFREEDFFLRIFSCLYSARSPHSLEPCLWIKIFRTFL